MNSTPLQNRRQELRVLLLESFYGGSHRDVADGLVRHSRHSIHLLTLPARFWKWRMRGASLWFFKQLDAEPLLPYDLIFCTSLMDVGALKALLGRRCPPILLYCHETQLAYPDPGNNEADLHFAFTELVNMSVADRVLFNSESHRRRFLDALPAFLRRLPDFKPLWTVDTIVRKSAVCYPGITVEHRPATVNPSEASWPLIIWNHRWEFDKAPGVFFAALRELIKRRCEFQVALLGENFTATPREFADARRDFGDRIVQYGYVANREEYRNWLARGDIIVSTAIQENFGISAMEAVAHGCHPVLPSRLSYPEIIPAEFHNSCLYANQGGLVSLLEGRLSPDPAARTIAARRADPALVAHAQTFNWIHRVQQFDALIDEAAGARQ